MNKDLDRESQSTPVFLEYFSSYFALSLQLHNLLNLICFFILYLFKSWDQDKKDLDSRKNPFKNNPQVGLK